ncbi:hypothetical protein MKX03_006370, partial [Papaver bracteatum]
GIKKFSRIQDILILNGSCNWANAVRTQEIMCFSWNFRDNEVVYFIYTLVSCPHPG